MKNQNGINVITCFPVRTETHQSNDDRMPLKRNKSLNVNMQMMKFIKLTPKTVFHYAFKLCHNELQPSPQTEIPDFFSISMPLFAFFFFETLLLTFFS